MVTTSHATGLENTLLRTVSVWPGQYTYVPYIIFKWKILNINIFANSINCNRNCLSVSGVLCVLHCVGVC